MKQTCCLCYYRLMIAPACLAPPHTAPFPHQREFTVAEIKSDVRAARGLAQWVNSDFNADCRLDFDRRNQRLGR
jgi:hypothetical protein